MAANKKRKRLFNQQNGKCYYCDSAMYMKRDTPLRCTIDHIVPRCEGGKSDYGNIVAACSFCNGQKGAMDAHAFIIFAHSPAYKERLHLRDHGVLRSTAQKRKAKKRRQKLRRMVGQDA